MSEDYLVPLNAAVGRAVMEWNRIEHGLISLGLRLGGCLNPGNIRDPHQTLNLAFINMNLSARVATVKAYAAKSKIGKDFYNKLEKVLNRIENEHRLKRNRYVHDFWDIGDPDGGPISRIAFKSEVSRPQSHQLRVDNLKVATYKDVKEVAEFGDELRKTYAELGALDGQICSSEPFKAACKIAETTSAGRA